MQVYEAATLEPLYFNIFNDINDVGRQRSTRGTVSREFRNVAVTLTSNPHLFSIPKMVHNKCLAYGELMLILAGDDNVSSYSFYSSKFNSYADNLGKMPGAYGARIDWEVIKRLIWRIRSVDSETRRAVVNIYDWKVDTLPGSSGSWSGDIVDVACNLALHFIPEEGSLDLNVFARSTDFRRGFIYDTSMWSLLLALVADLCSMKTGSLTFITSSLHVYKDDVLYLEELNKKSQTGPLFVNQRWGPSFLSTPYTLQALAESESDMRKFGEVKHITSPLQTVSLLPLIQRYRRFKDKNALKTLSMSDAWKANEDYYRYAAGKLLD